MAKSRSGGASGLDVSQLSHRYLGIGGATPRDPNDTSKDSKISSR
jgi:hypothetical protein